MLALCGHLALSGMLGVELCCVVADGLKVLNGLGSPFRFFRELLRLFRFDFRAILFAHQCAELMVHLIERPLKTVDLVIGKY